ncbi:MAG: hypothetical protein AAGA09_08575 [Pseudomonadota bacterium]
MKNRTLIALFTMYCIAIMVMTPIAFYVGKARGDTGDIGEGLIAQAANTQAWEEALGERIHFESDCANLGQNGSITRRFGAQIDCQFRGRGGSKRYARLGDGAPRTKKALKRQRRSPLRQAVAKKVASSITQSPTPTNVAGFLSNSGADTGEFSFSPLSIALAPGANGGGGPQDPLGSLGGRGLPEVLVPVPFGLPGANPGTPPNGPADPAAPLVTPIPAAAPLMISGFGALLVAMRRRRKAAQ